MNIVVLAGGYSPERDVSFSSGSLIANALMKVGHKVALIDSLIGVDTIDESIFRDDVVHNYRVKTEEPDLEELKKNHDNGGSLIGKNVIEICKKADIVFIALHRWDR